MDIVRTEKVIKAFGDYRAVNEVSISVGEGKIFGLLGPNGAGKTTLIRMITNILMPDQGTVTLFGQPASSAHQNKMGYLPEERGLYKKVKVIDQLIYFGQLKGMLKSDAQSAAKNWLRQMDAADWEKKKIQELSKGMQQKVQFISTILHEPELLILDEPFSGFDPVNTELLKKIILDLKDSGKTIILSTHVMEQAEQLCDDICLIDKGKIMLDGKIRDIKKSYGRDTIIMEFVGDDSFLNNFTGLNIINRTRNRVEFRLNNSVANMKDIIKEAIERVDIYKLEFVEPSLHEIFIDVVTKIGNSNISRNPEDNYANN